MEVRQRRAQLRDLLCRVPCLPRAPLHHRNHIGLEFLERFILLDNLLECLGQLLLRGRHRRFLHVLLGEFQEVAHRGGGQPRPVVGLSDGAEDFVQDRDAAVTRQVQRRHLRRERRHDLDLVVRGALALVFLRLLGELGLHLEEEGFGLLLPCLALCGVRVHPDVQLHLGHDGGGVVGGVHGVAEVVREVLQPDLVGRRRKLHHHCRPHLHGVLRALVDRQQLHEKVVEALGLPPTRPVKLLEGFLELLDLDGRVAVPLDLVLHHTDHLLLEVLL
mmetsp:Transcript_24976/g.59601  ORF Transcript_24976/g.59601 Transcript_24976/m.59601 type:complete len:275 (-) Transcript_24976:439-1263(-)